MIHNTTLFVILAAAFIGLNGAAGATAQDAPSSDPLGACPMVNSGETAADCPWASVARDLIKAASSGGDVKKKLEEDLPILVSRFQADRDRSDWLKLWGESINFDELAKGIIVQPEIIKALAAELGTTAPDAGSSQHDVPAGVEHTYGYLFSVLPTSFGFKRARWVQPTLDQAFGFSEPTLTPLPSEGTLFGNATYFGGQIAFRGEKEKLAALQVHEDTIPERLRKFDYSKLQITRLEETVTSKGSTLVMRTDLVAFPSAVANDTNSYLLVYSISSPKTNGPVLISMFPVASSFVTMALDPKNLGNNKTIITRYNAYVEGLSGKKVKGLRKVIQ